MSEFRTRKRLQVDIESQLIQRLSSVTLSTQNVDQIPRSFLSTCFWVFETNDTFSKGNAKECRYIAILGPYLAISRVLRLLVAYCVHFCSDCDQNWSSFECNMTHAAAQSADICKFTQSTTFNQIQDIFRSQYLHNCSSLFELFCGFLRCDVETLSSADINYLLWFKRFESTLPESTFYSTWQPTQQVTFKRTSCRLVSVHWHLIIFLIIFTAEF